MAKLLSLAFVAILWAVAAAAARSPLLPDPLTVLEAVLRETRSLALPYHLACTLLRVVVAFAIAFSLGLISGYAMGKFRLIDQVGDPWLVVLLNLPALVTIVLAYIWVGLNEPAAIAAIALNKFPNVVVVIREGTRALSRELDEVAQVFRLSGPARIRHIVLPQLAPYLATAFRSGISITWKIVLVVEPPFALLVAQGAPVRPDHRQQHVAFGDLLTQHLDEVHAERNRVHVHEQEVAAKLPLQPVAHAPGMARAVVAAIADEEFAGHDA